MAIAEMKRQQNLEFSLQVTVRVCDPMECRDAEFLELCERGGKVLEEAVLVLSIQFNPRFHFKVVKHRNVGWEHNRHTRCDLCSLGDVHRVARCTPCRSRINLNPLLLDQVLEVLVVEVMGASSPWSSVAGAVRMHGPNGVGTTQGDYLLVVQIHAMENIAEVWASELSVWEPSLLDTVLLRPCVGTTRPPGDLRASHFLDGDHSG
mmetsp:Transcript_16454/g.40524  ORF Transcript_16454/g.40524 Transcript_16454/m.40524 type:complete len:206 (+) Transcript_16454:180-797(+)